MTQLIRALALVATVAASTSLAAQSAARVVAATPEAAGEYLLIVAGCHDCHTAKWSETQGKVPKDDQLLGSNVGYRGPWGTSYAPNLRLILGRMTEARWVQVLTTADDGEGKPPMPYHNSALAAPEDLKAMYAYIKKLGVKGERTPRSVPAGQEPTTPYINMVPVAPKP
jgi:opacity protein-like surface antigen